MNTIDPVGGPSAANTLWLYAASQPTPDDNALGAGADGPGRILQALEQLLEIIAKLLMQQYAQGDDQGGSQDGAPPAAGPQASSPPAAPGPAAPGPAASPQAPGSAPPQAPGAAP